MTVTSIFDLTDRQREFFDRYLRENPEEATDWVFEGYVCCGGRFGLFDVVNPLHPCQG